MTSVKILFRKEVEVDLNAYYPAFPPRLRREIDDQIFQLLGGQEVKPPTTIRKRKSYSNDTIFKFHNRSCRPNSKLGAFCAELKRQADLGQDFIKAEILEMLEKNNFVDSIRFSELVKNGILTPITD